MADTFKLTIRDQTFTVKIKSNSKWEAFHVTKHLIHGYHNEGYDKLFGIGSRLIGSVLDDQKNKFECKVSEGSIVEMTCKPCSYFNECSRLIKDIKDPYISGIKNTFINDHKKPRHASYKYGIGNFVVIGDNGIVVVGIINNQKTNNIVVLTSYRSTIKTELGIDSIKKRNEIYLKKARDNWQNKFNSSKFKEVDQYLLSNWIS